MIGFEPPISGVGNDFSTNWDTNTALTTQKVDKLLLVSFVKILSPRSKHSKIAQSGHTGRKANVHRFVRTTQVKQLCIAGAVKMTLVRTTKVRITNISIVKRHVLWGILSCTVY